nr:MAG TPA: hypothetical protein [Caudoviricetes sp.]
MYISLYIYKLVYKRIELYAYNCITMHCSQIVYI